MIISRDAEKAYDKIHHPFMIKTLSKVGIQGANLNIIKAIYEKPTANVILNEQKLNLSPYDQEQDKGVHFHHFYSTYIGSSSHSKKTIKKKLKGIHIGKQEVKLIICR